VGGNEPKPSPCGTPSSANSVDIAEGVPFLDHREFPETFKDHLALEINPPFGRILYWKRLYLLDEDGLWN